MTRSSQRDSKPRSQTDTARGAQINQSAKPRAEQPVLQKRLPAAIHRFTRKSIAR